MKEIIAFYLSFGSVFIQGDDGSKITVTEETKKISLKADVLYKVNDDKFLYRNSRNQEITAPNKTPKLNMKWKEDLSSTRS